MARDCAVELSMSETSSWETEMLVEKELRERAKDVRAFLKSLKDIEDKITMNSKLFYRPQDMVQASRAASFIMMYNCVELAIADSLSEARDNIEASGKTFSELKPHWQRELIRYSFKQKLESGCNFEDLLEDFRMFIPGKVQWGANRTKMRPP